MLSSLLLFQSGGWYLCHHIQVHQVRHEMKQRLKHNVPEEYHVTLKIPFSMEEGHPDFQRFHEREFRYKGEMYDILKSETHGDTTWYTCIHDVKESGLFKNLDTLVSLQLKQGEEEHRQNSLMLALFSKLFLGGFNYEDLPVTNYDPHLFYYCTNQWEAISYKPWKPPCSLFYINS